MPKNQRDSDSDSDKSRNDSGSGSDGEEEEYVVEKVVDKRTKNGKVSHFVQISLISFNFCLKYFFRLSIFSNGKDMIAHKIHGSQKRIWNVMN